MKALATCSLAAFCANGTPKLLSASSASAGQPLHHLVTLRPRPLVSLHHRHASTAAAACLPVLPMHDARLRRICDLLPQKYPSWKSAEGGPHHQADTVAFTHAEAALVSALEAFRAKYGFGRAMAAPQLGFNLRLIALNLGQGPFVMRNPKLADFSEATFTMWDDCMCFPELLVKVRRHKTLTVTFQDEQGNEQVWKEVPQAVAELLQHEVDHLDGLLSFDRVEMAAESTEEASPASSTLSAELQASVAAALAARAQVLGSGAAGASLPPSVLHSSIITREAYAARKAFYDSQVDYVIQPTIKGHQ